MKNPIVRLLCKLPNWKWKRRLCGGTWLRYRITPVMAKIIHKDYIWHQYRENEPKSSNKLYSGVDKEEFYGKVRFELNPRVFYR